MEIKPFDPMTLLWISLLNPVVIAVAFVMGRKSDQWQKLIVAAFAASLCGVGLYWLAAQLGLLPIHAIGGEAAILLLQFLFALVWASIGYMMRPR